jgi:hypothetical protein
LTRSKPAKLRHESESTLFLLRLFTKISTRADGLRIGYMLLHPLTVLFSSSTFRVFSAFNRAGSLQKNGKISAVESVRIVKEMIEKILRMQ